MTIESLSLAADFAVAFAQSVFFAANALMCISHTLKCLCSVREARKRRKYQEQRQALLATDYWTLKRLKLQYNIPTASMKKIDLVDGFLAYQFT